MFIIWRDRSPKQTKTINAAAAALVSLHVACCRDAFLSFPLFFLLNWSHFTGDAQSTILKNSTATSLSRKSWPDYSDNPTSLSLLHRSFLLPFVPSLRSTAGVPACVPAWLRVSTRRADESAVSLRKSSRPVCMHIRNPPLCSVSIFVLWKRLRKQDV